jgi:hypothetical protein
LQNFLPYIKKLPKDEVKVLIGDNLAAHLSPVVIDLCQLHNVRFIFLPENSTHLLQPLDVAVFGPMKRRWRQVLTAWKEKCASNGTNYATIPKQSFPGLLGQLLEKDFGPCIRSGFESTGLFPFSLEKALSKLPAEERDVETDVQRQLLKKLDEMRYSAPATTHAKRPKKSEKLPAGAAYTCAVESDDDDDEEATVRPRRIRPAGDSSDSDISTSSDSDESSDQEERRETVQKIVERLRRKRSLFDNEEEQQDDNEEEQQDDNEEEQQDETLPEPDEPTQEQPAEDAVQAGIYLVKGILKSPPPSHLLQEFEPLPR